MNCSTPASSVLHYLPEFAQTHVHWVSDAIQRSQPLSSPSPFALNLSQHRGLSQWFGSWHQVAKVLELQHQSFQWILKVDFLEDWLVWSPWCPRDSLLQHHNFKASLLRCSFFFTVQLPCLSALLMHKMHRKLTPLPVFKYQQSYIIRKPNTLEKLSWAVLSSWGNPW